MHETFAFRLPQTPQKAWQLLTAGPADRQVGDAHLDQLHYAAELVWKFTCVAGLAALWRHHHQGILGEAFRPGSFLHQWRRGSGPNSQSWRGLSKPRLRDLEISVQLKCFSG